MQKLHGYFCSIQCFKDLHVMKYKANKFFVIFQESRIYVSSIFFSSNAFVFVKILIKDMVFQCAVL